MKLKLFFLYLLLSMACVAQNKPVLTWEIYKFFIPDSSHHSCYAEVALSVSPYNLNIQKNKDSSYFVAVNGCIEIWNENQLIKRDSFLFKSPSAKKYQEIPYFGYIRRYWLNNQKKYSVKLFIKDYFSNDTSSVLKLSKDIEINFQKNNIELSSVQFIDVLEKSNQKDMYFKYGYTLIPYTDNYFNENFDKLNFTFEIYNTDKVLGKAEPFVVYFRIKDKDNNKVLDNFGGFKKLSSSSVNVVISGILIKDLPSGNYFLIIEIKDKNNKTIKEEQIYFQRKNVLAKQISPVEEELFFGKQNSVDTLKMWLEALWPIANNVEKEWIINQSIVKDPQLMKNFMINFWEKRASDTTSAVELAKKYYSRLNYVMKNFKCGKIAPYLTDRGRVYLQYGEPNQRTIQLSEPGAYPYEIWQYYRIYDGATNQFFTNRRFVFVNKGIADECYTLIHSDMRGEYNNPNWQREIMKYDIYNINDPYQQLRLNYGNNFDKFYQNPQ